MSEGKGHRDILDDVFTKSNKKIQLTRFAGRSRRLLGQGGPPPRGPRVRAASIVNEQSRDLTLGELRRDDRGPGERSQSR